MSGHLRETSNDVSLLKQDKLLRARIASGITQNADMGAALGNQLQASQQSLLPPKVLAEFAPPMRHSLPASLPDQSLPNSTLSDHMLNRVTAASRAPGAMLPTPQGLSGQFPAGGGANSPACCPPVPTNGDSLAFGNPLLGANYDVVTAASSPAGALQRQPPPMMLHSSGAQSPRLQHQHSAPCLGVNAWLGQDALQERPVPDDFGRAAKVSSRALSGSASQGNLGLLTPSTPQRPFKKGASAYALIAAAAAAEGDQTVASLRT